MLKWRRGRAAECGGLENRYSRNRIVGSNPTASAIIKNMLIDLKKTRIKKQQKIENYFGEKEAEQEELLPAPHDLMIKEYSRDALMHWRSPEFEKSGWDRRWYLIATLVLAAIVIYALVSNSPIMAITFILIGIVGYIYLQKEPRILDFMITYDGIIAGKEIYEFRDIKSFWIFYEPHIKVISLRMKGKILPHIHIPIHDQDPVKIREDLLKFIPEKEQELTLVDAIEKILRL